MSTYNLFTSESVSEGHPDKMADQISDAVLDAIIADDPHSRVAVETMVKTGMAIIAGEVRTNTYVDLEQIVRDVITDLCAHDQDWVKQSCGDLWLGFDPSEITGWAETAGLTEGNSLFLSQRNGFRIQLRQFNKVATTT